MVIFLKAELGDTSACKTISSYERMKSNTRSLRALSNIFLTSRKYINMAWSKETKMPRMETVRPFICSLSDRGFVIKKEHPLLQEYLTTEDMVYET
jgi:hypothetical protein